ncbi:MAG: thiamine pyrophosphate-dependent enzyme [Burkholderiales bacterium]
MMKRDDFLKVLAKHRTEEVVVAVYTAAQEFIQISPHPLNYTFTGAMGQGSSHALGIALGRPDKRVIVLDGDGSLLMNLGTLVTIAHAAPKNLLHCLCRNGSYETNGAVSIPNRENLSFPAMATAAGYRRALSISSLEDWDRQLPGLLVEPGPVFVDIEMQKGATYKEDFERLYDPSFRDAFRRALAASK